MTPHMVTSTANGEALAWLYLGWATVFLLAVFVGYALAGRNDTLGRKRK